MGFFSRKKKSNEDILAREEADAQSDSQAVGPWDESDHPERGDLLDAGSLWLPLVPGANIQYSVDQRRKAILGVLYVKDGSALQLQAFAAPKSSGLWDEVRAEMVSVLAAQGGHSELEEGEYGTEIRAVVPTPDKSANYRIRYIGIDGPRWLLRANVTGKGATDDAAASDILHAVLDDLVVVRGQGAHPPKEMLPLVAKQQKEPEPKDELKLSLPARGPEISEVR
ncbi:MAG: DUF3710 domain-containing protein [Ancrocorticia sp.]